MQKISVIILNYNDSRFLINIVSKMAAQYPDEIIVVDDGSTDRSMDLLLALKDKYDIKVISNTEDKGCAGAFVSGCYAAKNEYVSCWSCDDEPLPGYMDRMEKAINDYPLVNLVTCNACVMREGRGYIRGVLPFDSFISPDYAVKMFKAGLMRNINVIGLVIKKGSVIGCYDHARGIKANFDAMYAFFEVFSRGMLNLGEPLVLYRSYPNGIGASGNAEDITRSIDMQLDYFAFKDPKAFERAVASGIWAKDIQILHQYALKIIPKLPLFLRREFYKRFYGLDRRMEKL